MNTPQKATRRERRESSRELTVSTWHNGRFGVYRWNELTDREKSDHMAALERNQYVHNFGVYA